MSILILDMIPDAEAAPMLVATETVLKANNLSRFLYGFVLEM